MIRSRGKIFDVIFNFNKRNVILPYKHLCDLIDVVYKCTYDSDARDIVQILLDRPKTYLIALPDQLAVYAGRLFQSRMY